MEVKYGGVRSVEKAMAILDYLASAGRPMMLQEISEGIGYPKSTVHAMLCSLRKNAAVEQSPTDGRYRLGVRLFELGSVVGNSWDVLTVAKPHLQELVWQTRESADLAMLERNDILLVEHFDATDPLHVVTQVGSHLPLHCTALGKAMLAFAPDRERRRLMNTAEFVKHTPHTIEPECMERELELVRERGVATENGEFRVGLRAVAAPIFDSAGRALHSIGVTGMFRRVESEDFQHALTLVRAAADKISQECGYNYR
jgi:DNA-binding IclR family transcriptional regulator